MGQDKEGRSFLRRYGEWLRGFFSPGQGRRATVGIGFTIREKFSWALRSLQSIYQGADVPFTLYFVDAVYPAEVRQEVDAFLRDKTNVVRVTYDRFLLENESLNEVIARSHEPYLFCIQNDVIVSPGYLGRLLATHKKFRCDIVSPAIHENQNGTVLLHQHDEVTAIRREGGQIVMDIGPNHPEPPGQWPSVFMEPHCFLMTRRAARQMAPLCPWLNTRTHYEFSIKAWTLGLSIYEDTEVEAIFARPPIHDYDRAFFAYRWDLERARKSNEHVRRTWNLRNLPSSMPYVTSLQRFLEPGQLAGTLAA